MPIAGVHAMFYSAAPDALRTFFRDQLCLPFTDVGGGWLIFDLPAGDLGVHPTSPPIRPTPLRRPTPTPSPSSATTSKPPSPICNREASSLPARSKITATAW